jgi:hypothetical protein
MGPQQIGGIAILAEVCPTAARNSANHVLQGRMNRMFPEMNLAELEEHLVIFTAKRRSRLRSS